MHLLPHLAARILGTPLLIQPQKLEVILSVLGMRIGVTQQSVHNALLPIPSLNDAENALYHVDRIAVIPVTGSLVNRALGLDAASGLTSYRDMRRSLETALTDPNVDGVLFDIDSPGGEAGGAFDLSDRIFAARKLKPIWAVANDQAFSAAYAIASSCERMFVTRTGGVGSIGVIALHVDQSQKDAQDGYRYTPVYAGQHKNDFNPHAPLSPDAQTALQAEVDRLQILFTSTVARNRGLSEEAVRATEAALFFGENALATHLADATGTFDDAIAELTDVVRLKRVSLQPRAGNPASKRGLLAPSTLSTLALSTINQESPSMDTTNPAAPETHALEAPSGANPPTDAAANAVIQATAIAELCLLAGMPERTADLLKRGVNLDDARRELLSAKAAAGSVEIHSRLAPSATNGVPQSLDQNPVVKAARARAAAPRA